MTAWRERARAATGSLKIRLTIGSTAALALGIGLTTALLVHQAERDTLAAAQERELAQVVHLAEDVAQQLAERRAALESAARHLDRALLADPKRLPAAVEAQPALIHLFADISVASAEGRVLARAGDADRLPPAPEALREAVATLRPGLSVVTPDGPAAEPAIVLTHPLADAAGVYGVVAGDVRLSSRALLGHLMHLADPDDGELVVVTDATGRILAHPDSRQLLQPLAGDPHFGAAAGHALAAGGPSARGLHMHAGESLISASRVSGVGWQVWISSSGRALLEPLHAARREALGWAVGLSVGMALLLFAVLGWLLRPLRQLEHRAQHLFDGSQAAHDGWPEAEGEIGQLARVLRHVGAERAQLEQFNGEVLRKLSSVMSAAPVGIAFMRNRRFELVSAEFCRLTGRTESDLIGELASTVLASPGTQRRLGVQAERAFRTGLAFVGEGEVQRADGSRFWAQLRGRPVDAGDASAGVIWTVSDISTELAERERLEWSATHDPLTRLANRKAFDQRAQRLFAMLPRSLPAAVAVIDLDHFKPINDLHGHAAGDAMLQAVADAITSCVRASDLAVRFGGDEFAILLEHCPYDAALRIAESVRAAISAIALPWNGRSLNVGASVGIASLGHEVASVADWVQSADAACYAAKAAGRGAVRAAARPALRVVGGGPRGD